MPFTMLRMRSTLATKIRVPRCINDIDNAVVPIYVGALGKDRDTVFASKVIGIDDVSDKATAVNCSAGVSDFIVPDWRTNWSTSIVFPCLTG